MTDGLTPEEIAKVTVLTTQLTAIALKVLRPLEITMRDKGWPADECALMWRVIASAALDNAKREDARS